MKKIIALCLVIVMLTGCSSGGVSQAEYDKLAKRNEELSTALGEAIEIAQKYTSEKAEEFETRDITFAAIGSNIDEASKCTILNDDVVLLTVPMGVNDVKTVKANIEKFAMMIPSAIKISEFKSCIMIVVDSDNFCSFGYTFKAEGDPSTFVSDKFNAPK